MRILVAGGAGFIGSHYVRTLLDGGYPGYGHAHVTVVDKLTYAGNLASLEPAAASPRFSFIRGDIADAALLDSVVAGHDVVVNFAAETGPGAAAPGLVAANVAGVQVLLQACADAGVARVVQVSTGEVYGSAAGGPRAEDARLDPGSPYAAAKAGGDLIAAAYARACGLNVSITRCCDTYGPYQYPGKDIPLAVTSLLDGRAVALRDGGDARGWVHVDDHCRGIQLVIDKGEPGRVYHIGADAHLPDAELAQALLDCCGAGPEMLTRAAKPDPRARRCALDDSLLRGMGYAPQIPFSDGLKATVHWYRDNRRWWEPLSQPQPGPAEHPAAQPQRADQARTPPASRPRRRPSPRLRKTR